MQLDSAPALYLGELALPIPIGLPKVFSNDNYVTAGATFSVPVYTNGLISSAIDATLTVDVYLAGSGVSLALNNAASNASAWPVAA